MKTLISAFLILFSTTAFCGSAFDLGSTVGGKANKVSGATSGNLASLTSDGDLQDSGKSAASGFVSSVTGTSPITATTSGSGVTLAHADSGATAGTYGVSGSSIPILAIDAKGHVTYASSWLTSLITSVGTITAGTWQGSAVGVAYGGTGSTTAAGALTALGAAPVAGSSSITTVGTIGSGTWNGTAIASGYVATALSGKTITGSTYNGTTPTANTTGFSIAGGTTLKTLTVTADVTLSGTPLPMRTGTPTVTAITDNNTSTAYISGTDQAGYVYFTAAADDTSYNARIQVNMSSAMSSTNYAVIITPRNGSTASALAGKWTAYSGSASYWVVGCPMTSGTTYMFSYAIIPTE